jgi:hypothetical protein
MALALTSKREAERAVDGAMTSSAEAEIRAEGCTSIDPVIAERAATAFPISIGLDLATALANGTDMSAHHDRSVSLSRNDLGG